MTSSLKTSSTVLLARKEIGRALSQADPHEQLRVLNLVREWAYANQRELGLDLSLTMCVQIECFCHDCPPCPDKPYYQGFRLPSRFQSLEAVRYSNTHVPVKSHWRLPYDGISGFPNDPRMQLFDNGFKPLERDFLGCQPSQLRFVSEGCSDDCQKMLVKGKTYDGQLDTWTYDVGKDAKITDQYFTDVEQITFPSGVSGRIIIAQPDGRELARIGAGEVSPQFREFKIIGGCACDTTQLIISANCTYAPVADDYDLVEFGSPLVWQTLARYIRLLNKDGKDNNDRQNMTNYLATATSLMINQAAVEIGESTDFRFRRRPIKGSRLANEHYGARRY